MDFFAATARFFDTFVGPVVMLIYPLSASIKAIENPSERDEQQWLTYWVLYSLITLFEISCYNVSSWLCIWPYLKLIMSLWLVLPMFKGAAYIYENHVRQLASRYQSSSDLTKGKEQILRMMSPDARAGVERYIAKHGLDAFERVIKAAESEARKTKRLSNTG